MERTAGHLANLDAYQLNIMRVSCSESLSSCAVSFCGIFTGDVELSRTLFISATE